MRASITKSGLLWPGLPSSVVAATTPRTVVSLKQPWTSTSCFHLSPGGLGWVAGWSLRRLLLLFRVENVGLDLQILLAAVNSLQDPRRWSAESSDSVAPSMLMPLV